MNSIENMLCSYCKNTTITTTEKTPEYTFNKSEDSAEASTLYSICTTCNKFSYIQPGTLLYSEAPSKNIQRLSDVKYDPKLIEITGNCEACKQDTIFKQFATNNFDLKYKYICIKCDTIFASV